MTRQLDDRLDPLLREYGETNFTVQKGTLPRLPFGALYQFRARAVDLAGNSISARRHPERRLQPASTAGSVFALRARVGARGGAPCGAWKDPVDDLSDNPQPVILGRLRAGVSGAHSCYRHGGGDRQRARGEQARVSRHQASERDVHRHCNHAVQGILPGCPYGGRRQHHTHVAAGDALDSELGATARAQASLRGAYFRLGVAGRRRVEFQPPVHRIASLPGSAVVLVW